MGIETAGVGNEMIVLERITCEYIESEDRIRMSGEVASARPLVIWLTQRLLKRLIPMLIPLLEDKQTDPHRAEAMQVFAQQAAKAQLKPQVPVQAQTAEAAWVASSVDIATTAQTVTLIFHALDGQKASFVMQAQPLRQWLDILHRLYVMAEWSQDVWPEWVKGSALTVQERSAALH